jgi:CMP-N-acetylneuraminic acid synthetase
MLPKEIDAIINHKMFKDIDSDTSLSDAQKYSKKLARAKEISKAMNEASQLILNSDDIQQRPTGQGIQSDWGSPWKNPGG